MGPPWCASKNTSRVRMLARVLRRVKLSIDSEGGDNRCNLWSKKETNEICVVYDASIYINHTYNNNTVKYTDKNTSWHTVQIDCL